MAKLLKDEYSMVTFKTYKDGKREKTNTIINVLLNFLFRGVAGSVPIASSADTSEYNALALALLRAVRASPT